MKCTLLVTLVVATVAVVRPQCTPDQWEGYEGSVGGYSFRGRPGMIKEFVSTHYDFKNKRSATFLDYVNGEYENKFQIVVRDGHLYIVNKKHQSCYMKKMERPFRQCCLPESAKHLGDYSLGLAGGFKVSGYEVEKDGIKTEITVQKKGGIIIPIGEIAVGRLGDDDGFTRSGLQPSEIEYGLLGVLYVRFKE